MLKLILVTLFSLSFLFSYAQEREEPNDTNEQIQIENTNEEIVDALTLEKNISWYQEVGLLEEANQYMEENLPEEWEEENSAKADKNLYGFASDDAGKHSFVALLSNTSIRSRPE